MRKTYRLLVAINNGEIVRELDLSNLDDGTWNALKKYHHDSMYEILSGGCNYFVEMEE